MARTHPPLDPELAAALTAVNEQLSPRATPEDIEALRASPMLAGQYRDLRSARTP
jgi:hypothetical protein